MTNIVSSLILMICLIVPAVSTAEPERGPGNVTDERVQQEFDSGYNWPVNGGRFTGEHYSPLSKISDRNVEKLGLAWATNLPSPIGLVAEPIAVDGVVYLSGTFSVVYALDALTGRLLWQFNPVVRVDLSLGSSASARWNRGVAVWKGKVYVGTGDCRLVAIDAAHGKKLWESPVCDPKEGDGAGITGAPRVARDKVLMGYLGSDTAVRGALVAFDAETGKEAWRFWTVPGDPAKGFETKQLEDAAKTWTGGTSKFGGGVVWEAIRYDPVTGFVIFGTASTIPLNVKQRGPGDNLFTNSVIAVDVETGAYQWHYQTVPEDAWDYDATMPKIVTELRLGEKQRRVVFEAGKSGFFYVLDARDGELLSADPISTVTWASHVDMETGRPVVIEEARYYEGEEPVRISPNSLGARNWQPMSFSPKTGLVYMPVTDMPSVYSAGGYIGARVEFGYKTVNELPADAGRLVAWDPAKRSIRWSVNHALPFNGGVLSTGGNLVFQGTGTGELRAHHAKTGQLLWSRATGSSIQSTPISYQLGEEQYVLVAIGKGGGISVLAGWQTASAAALGPARVLAFKLGGSAEIPIEKGAAAPVPEPPARTATTEQIRQGNVLYEAHGCSLCHGESLIGAGKRVLGGGIPDLRYAPAFVHEQWEQIVVDGQRRPMGMPGFRESGMTPEDAEAIRVFVVDAAWKAYEADQDSR